MVTIAGWLCERPPIDRLHAQLPACAFQGRPGDFLLQALQGLGVPLQGLRTTSSLLLHGVCGRHPTRAAQGDSRWRSMLPEGRRKNAERQERWRKRQRRQRAEGLNAQVVTYEPESHSPEISRRPIVRTKWPRREKTPPTSARVDPLDRENSRDRCTFCGKRACHRSSHPALWARPSRWAP